MKHYSLLVKSFAFLTIAAASSSSAWAGIIYLDDNYTISSYPSSTPSIISSNNVNFGAAPDGMAFTTHDGAYGIALLVAPSKGNEIYAYTSAGPNAIPFAAITNPTGLAIDSSGNVYVGATGGSTLEELSPNGLAVVRTIATGVGVESLAVDGAGDVFEADNSTGFGVINEYTPAGGSTPAVAITLPNTTYVANDGIALDASGDLFVTFWSGKHSGGIYEITPSGVVSTFYSASTLLPTGLAYDTSTGNLDMSYVNSTTTVGGGFEVFSPNAGGVLNSTPGTPVTDSVADPYGIAVLAPEPGTILLLLSGLTSVWLLRMRGLRAVRVASVGKR